jgi:hypothetical protein
VECEFERTFTPEAMMAARSFCQGSTESQESLPGPAMVGMGETVVSGCGWDCGNVVGVVTWVWVGLWEFCGGGDMVMWECEEVVG